VLDALWQAVTGRTRDGATEFALNPPETTSELLNRLVWPKAYPAAVDLALELMGVTQGDSLVLAPAIVTCASTGHIEILKRLLSCALDDNAKSYLLDNAPWIAACGQLPCCEIIFPLLAAFRSNVGDYDAPLSITLKECIRVSDLMMIKFLLTHYAYAFFVIEHLFLRVVSQRRSFSDAAFEMILNSLPSFNTGFLSYVLRFAARVNRIDVVQNVLARGLDDKQIFFAAETLLTESAGPEVVTAMFARLDVQQCMEVILKSIAEPQEFSVVSALLARLQDHPRSEVQDVLDGGLIHSVSRVQNDQIGLYLQHGARARAGDDYIIYLAAISGHADVMELLLGAADVDAECAARYRQKMSEPSGLLGIAQQLRQRDCFNDSRLAFEPEDYELELSTALCGGCIPALKWLLSQPTCGGLKLKSAWPFVQAVQSGNLALVRTLLEPESVQKTEEWSCIIQPALRAARETQNFEMIHLLFPESLIGPNASVWDVRKVIHANDPFSSQYLFGYFEPAEVDVDDSESEWHEQGLPTLLEACMTGNLALFHDVWTFVRCAFQSSPELFESLSPRIDRALKLCTENDLAPLLMILMPAWSAGETHRDYNLEEVVYHPIQLAAKYGYVSAVQLWLAQGIPAQWALSVAVKHGQREVVACVIANGANLSELSS